jgi:hypothetical protein
MVRAIKFKTNVVITSPISFFNTGQDQLSWTKKFMGFLISSNLLLGQCLLMENLKLNSK